jgi:hypothetical protein
VVFDYPANQFKSNQLNGTFFIEGTSIAEENVILKVEQDVTFVTLFAEPGKVLLQMRKNTGQIIILDEDKEKVSSGITPSKYLGYRLRKVFGIEDSNPSPSISGIAARFAGPQVQIAPGKSVFEGFEQLKKIYAAKTSSPTFVFPKAYCIGRAMTLMNPIFKEELSKPTDMPIVQVCSPKLDFEVGGNDYMPRARSVASANLYFKSFVALFYDSFRIGGDMIEFTQTEDGKSKLLEASKLLAQLYRVKPEDQHKFLLGSIHFPQLNTCVSMDSTKASPTIIYIKDQKFRQEFFTKNLVPMLNFQEQHTAKVNSLLKKLFTMKGERLLLHPKLLAGGRVELNAIGYEAHQLLLEYYLKSEAYYIKGCIELNNNKGKLQT